MGVQIDRRGRLVFHRLGHQRHAFRRRQRQLHAGPGRGTAPGVCPEDLAPCTDGLFITSGLVILFVLCFDLSGVAMMGSGAFLLIYAGVNAAHLRVIAETGARNWLIWLALVTCLAMFGVLWFTFIKTRGGPYYHGGLAARLLRPGVGLPEQNGQGHQAENLVRGLTRGSP